MAVCEDEFIDDILDDYLPFEVIQEHDIQTFQSPFLNDNFSEIEILSETTSLNFSESGLPKT